MVPGANKKPLENKKLREAEPAVEKQEAPGPGGARFEPEEGRPVLADQDLPKSPVLPVHTFPQKTPPPPPRCLRQNDARIRQLPGLLRRPRPRRHCRLRTPAGQGIRRQDDPRDLQIDGGGPAAVRELHRRRRTGDGNRCLQVKILVFLFNLVPNCLKNFNLIPPFFFF